MADSKVTADSKAVRLIIHTSSLGLSDAHTFKNAAATLEKEYNRLYPKDSVDRVFVYSGRDIVRAINRQSPGSIVSLDIISHGNQCGIHIARRLARPVESGFPQKHLHYRIRRSSDRPQTQADAEYCEESIHGLYIDWLALRFVSYYYNQVELSESDVAYLYHIKYDRFQTEAYIELHGCLIAETIPFVNTYLRDNFSERLSENLPKGCTLVGHTTRSNPNRVPSSRTSDYRHGPVNVYRDGNIFQEGVERTKQKFPNSSTP